MAHYRKETVYIGQFSDGAEPPKGAVECPAPPTAFHTWDGSKWVEPETTVEQLRANASMYRAKFAIAAYQAGLITEQEAEDWAGGTAIPAWVSDTIDGAIQAGHIPADERLPVRIAVRTQERIGRTDRLIPILAQSADLTPEQVDALFGVG